MENYIFEDVASLMEWFDENETCFLIPYIEKNFHPASWNHQLYYMRDHLFFSKKIIQDNKLTNGEKQVRILNQLSYGKSKIVVIEGGRGSGKTATACWFIDELHSRKFHTKIFYVKRGERPPLPSWVIHVPDIEDVSNNSIAIIDETAIKYGNRNTWKDENKDFVSRLTILRHKGTSLILITQHMKMIDIGIRRLADIKIFKKGANLTHEDEAADDERVLIRNRLKPLDFDQCLVEIPISNDFFKFKHGLVDWWNDKMSKSYADYNPEEHSKKERMDRIKYAKEQEANKWKQMKEIELAKIDRMKELGIQPAVDNKIKSKKAEELTPADLL